MARNDSGLVGKLIDAGESIPVVDVLAATAGTVFGVKEDAQAHGRWASRWPRKPPPTWSG